MDQLVFMPPTPEASSAPAEEPHRLRLQGTSLLIGAIAVIVAISVLVALAGSFDRGLTVTRAEFGPAWPLTVPKGTLRCEFRREITFQLDGTTYSLNRPSRYGANSDITPLRAKTPDGAVMSLTPLVDRGLALCK